jgi:plasmid stabilization system protein ParE
MAESKPYRVHPEVWLEIEAGDDWYLERSVDASAGFIAAIADAFESISQAPKRWPNICTEPGGSCFIAFRFPSFTSMTPTS